MGVYLLLFLIGALLFNLHVSSAKLDPKSVSTRRAREKVLLLANDGNNQAKKQPNETQRSLFAPLNMSKMFQGALQLFISDVDVLKLVSRFCSVTVYLTLTLSVLGSVGYDTKPLLGLASVVLVALGIGAKDLISNTFAGLFVAFARPFRRNSKITIHSPYGMSFSGRVLSIDMRYLRLQDPSKQGTTLIPLNFCLNKPITVEEL